MKANKINIVAIIICLALQNGCSMIGYNIGKNISLREKEIYRIAEIKNGQKTTILLYDGRSATGLWNGIKKLEPESYRKMYHKYKSKDQELSVLPDLGDTVKFEIRDGEIVYLVFQGIAFEYRLFRSSRYSNDINRYLFYDCIGLEKEDEINLYFDDVVKYSCNDTLMIDNKDFKNLALENRLPINSQLSLIIADDTENYRLVDVRSFKSLGSGRWNGFILGLALDAFVVAGMISVAAEGVAPDF